MALRPTGKLGFTLRTVFAAMVLVALVFAYPSITEMFGLWSPLVGGLLVALAAGIAKGKWFD